MRWVIAAILAVLAVEARGQTTAPVSGETVAKLVAQLGGDDWNARQKAQDKLVDLGEDALPDLKQYRADATDEEVRTRLEAAIRQIEAEIANGPTQITLHVKDASISDVLAELSKQAKVTVGFPSGNPAGNAPAVTLDVDRQPFWLVMKEIARQTKVGPYPFSASTGQGMITVQTGSNFADLPGVNEGCFYVTAVQAHRSHTLDYSQPQNANTSFYLRLAAYADPRMHIIQSSDFRIKEMVDEKGNAIVANPSVRMSSGPGVFFRRDISIPLRYDPNLGKKIVKLSGTIDMMAQTKTLRWEIEEPLKIKDASKTTPMAKITIKVLTKMGEGDYELSVSGEREPSSVGDMMAICDFSTVRQSLQLLDAQGRAYRQSGGGGNRNDTTFNYRYRFTRSGGNVAAGEPAKLIWDLPMECKPVSVPVELRDLELP